jgi:hypothetical protein
VRWAISAAFFVAFLVALRFEDRVLQVEVAFVAAATLLCGLLGALYARSERPR